MTPFADIRVTEQTAGALAVAYDGIMAALADPSRRDAGLAAFDDARRRFDGWKEHAKTRFYQDTADNSAQTARDLADVLAPIAQGYETGAKRLALSDPAWLAAAVGPHVVALWRSDVEMFDPAIADALTEEARLCARYTGLIASARIVVEGETVNLSGIEPYLQSLDRGVRERAARAKAAFFAGHGDAFDGIFDDLVRLRDGMARTLGYENFVTLGYHRMRRTDYNAADVAIFREAVVAHVVPVLTRFFERLRAEFGYDVLRNWDERLLHPAGNPKPAGDEARLLDGADLMFSRLNPDMASFYRAMRRGNLMDLTMRPDKAVCGFCTTLGDNSVPFIFADFNGTFGDVEVLTHEMGHAFQCHSSRDLGGFDTLWPTAEACEIHSMSLELLTLPEIGCLVGDAAPRTVRHVLVRMLSIMTECAMGDHFQHDVYADPAMTPADRRARWLALGRLYAPWRRFEDIPQLAAGGGWHRTLHVFELPFYFIDYALAGVCALQFWHRSQAETERAWDEYLALCRRGGSAPFRQLVAGANLASPFEPTTVATVAQLAETALLG